MHHVPLRTSASALLTAALSMACAAADDASFAGAPSPNPTGGNTNVGFSGGQDIGYFRRLLEAGVVPRSADLDDAGFFAEHHTPLPEPTCGEHLCVQGMVGVLGNLMNGEPCTLLQVGLNSPLTVNAEDRPPLDLVIVIDVSGSMRTDGKLDFVKDGLRQMLDALFDEDRVALITYSDAAAMVHPLGLVRGQRGALRDRVDELYAAGSTNLWAGLELGYRSLLDHGSPEHQRRVILLSDGQPTRGPTATSDLLDRSAAYNLEGVGLTTIGLGTSFNAELMRGLAEQGDGNFYFIEDAGAVTEVFTEELAYFTLPVAFDLKLSVQAGRDFSLGAGYGTSRLEPVEGGFSLGLPSVFLAHRTSDDDVTPDGGRRGGGSALLFELMAREDDGTSPDSAHVATIDLSYRSPSGEGERVEERLEIAYPYPAWTIPERGHFDHPIVTKSFVMLNILLGMRLACDLHHEGAGSSGIAVLRRLIAAVRDYEEDLNEGAGDTDMKLDIALMERLIDVMVLNGSVDPDNPSIPANPWPGD